MTGSSATVDWALAYARLGFVVMPLDRLDNEPHKKLLGWGWHFCGTCKADGRPEIGTTDPEVIECWWREDPQANLGVVTGARSGLLDLDVDVHGEDGHVEFTRWLLHRQLEGKVLPEHPTYRTPSGGRHHWFRLPRDVHFSQNLHWLKNAEAKACGGQVAVPPSLRLVQRTTMEYGAFLDWEEPVTYEWESTIDVPLAPDWLIEDVRTRREKIHHGSTGSLPNVGRGRSDLPTTEWLTEHGLMPGHRDSDCYALACRLWCRHWPREDIVIDVVRQVWAVTTQPADQPPFTWDQALAKIRLARAFVGDQFARDRELAERIVGPRIET